jgi:outer membrane protein TolC
VATSKVELESAKEMLNMAKSAFKPTVDFSTSFARIDKDRARFARGTAPEKTIDVTLKLQQIIYSEEVFKLRDQAVFNRKAKEFLSDQAKLDIIQESSKAYLNVLRAETYLDITRDNLETTKANYELAKARHLAGAANPAELHRWEANIAMARKDKFSAETSVKLAMTELARVIGEDVDSEYDLENLRIFSDHTIFSASKSHIDMIDNDRSFRKFKTFMAKRAVEKSSELAAIDQLLKSGKRSVQSAERAYTHPTIALGGEYKRFLDKSGEGDEAAGYDDKEWNIGISLSIPIYEGGKRSAELQIEKANLRKTLYERSKIVKLVKQRMVAALENGRSAYTSYVLAKSAAKAANETFEIMTDLYSKGAISITELIDSQNAMLAAQLNVAASEYDFLEKMVDVERAYGQFFVFKTESEKRDFADLIKNIMN